MQKCRKYVLYRVTVRNKTGSIEAPFTKRKNAMVFVKTFKKMNPYSKSTFTIRKVTVPAERLSFLEKKAFKCGA